MGIPRHPIYEEFTTDTSYLAFKSTVSVQHTRRSMRERKDGENSRTGDGSKREVKRQASWKSRMESNIFKWPVHEQPRSPKKPRRVSSSPMDESTDDPIAGPSGSSPVTLSATPQHSHSPGGVYHAWPLTASGSRETSGDRSFGSVDSAAQEIREEDRSHFNVHASSSIATSFPPLPTTLPPDPVSAPHTVPPIHRWQLHFYANGLPHVEETISTPDQRWPATRCICGNALEIQISSRDQRRPAFVLHRTDPDVMALPVPDTPRDQSLHRASLPTEMLWIFHRPDFVIPKMEVSDGYSSTTICPFCFTFIYMCWDYNL